MDKLVESAKKEVLVEMVKLAQKRGMEGSKGQWKEFLKFYDKKFGASLSDPSRRDSDSLVAFLKTFNSDDHFKFFSKVLRSHSKREKVAILTSSSPDNESAEQRLVRMTLEHPQYLSDYFFPSYEEGWLVTRGGKKSDPMKSKKMIAIDCEMVLCEDGSDAVVKVCAVDHDLAVKLDEVVKPNKKIVDYRTNITGMSSENFDGVTLSLEDLQKSLKPLLSHGAILVGHGLSNDLNVLKLDHGRVIDTAYLFKFANGSSSKKPSLSLLCKELLNYDLRKEGHPHNCFDDACAAMKLVLARLAGKIDGVVPDQHRDLDVGKLLVHRIPLDVHTEDLKSIIPGEFSLDVKSNKNARKTYTVTSLFKSLEEAVSAFENLEGELEKDSCGRPQKLVKFELKSGVCGTLCVCKMNYEDSDTLLAKKRLHEAETDGAVKKMRTDDLSKQNECSFTQCEIHTREIERLKEELSKREQEILNLSKIITALARKQGL